MSEHSSQKHPRWIWVEWRPRKKSRAVSKVRLSKSVEVSHLSSAKIVPVPEPVTAMARRLGEASGNWGSPATVSVTAEELDSLKTLRDSIVSAAYRARKKSPGLTFRRGTPEWARPRSLEQTLADVTGRRPQNFSVCASSQRRPPHLCKK